MSPQTPSCEAYGDIESGAMFPPTLRQASLLRTPQSRIDDDMDPVQRRNALALLGDEQVFDFHKWARHRSAYKYAEQLASMPASQILRSCSLPVLWVCLISCLIYADDRLVSMKLIAPWMKIPNLKRIRTNCVNAHAVEVPLTITSFALSLLLVFRTNSSYGRFAEARQIWGMVLNRSRDLVRMCIAFFPTSDWDGKATFARWTICFSKCLLCHLRPRSCLRAEVSPVLSREELQILLAVNHPTVLCIQVLSELVQAAEVTSNQEWQLHTNLTELHDLLGACERILRTPIPVAYTRHTTRFLIIWLTVLPFALFPKFGIATLFVAPVIALMLAGINEIGIDVEEPFSLLPLESIADKAAMDCNELISTQVLLADRLIEARSEAMNGHVFTSTLNERLTNLCKEPDLLPLVRRERACISEGVLAQDTPPSRPSVVSTVGTVDLNLPPPPLSNLSSMRDSFRNDSLPSVRASTVSIMNGRHLEDTPGSSPRVAADAIKAGKPSMEGGAGVHDPRQLYFGRDKGPSRVSGFW